jgi:hypothetical protein
MDYEVRAHAHQGPTNYRVEVSGWDASEAFFCEKTTLYMQAEAHQICLCATLHKGAVVFVRLLQHFEGDDSFPIPYLVAENLPVEMNGRAMVSITRMHPTPSYRQSVTSIADHRRHVA